MTTEQTLFNQAVREGDLERVQALGHSPHVHPSACAQSALRMAARFGHLEIVIYLVEHFPFTVRFDAHEQKGEICFVVIHRILQR